MFFYLSKILWFVAAPSNLLVALTLVAAAAACRSARWRRVACASALAGALALALIGILPVGTLLLEPLEVRFPRPDLAGLDPAGIIVLGGAIEETIGAARGDTHLLEGAERLTAAVALARRFPNAKLVYSGQSNALLGPGGSESEDARRLWVSLGIAPERVALENRSRNTYENAQFTRELLRPEPGQRFILVTSAYHMPRAVGLFRKAEFDVVPYPVDYRSAGTLIDLVPMREASQGMRAFDVAVREWIGLVAYHLTGRIDALLPGP
ncbi:MAG: YdcF family protein [Methylobacteriaceae bacterium]|nr:YdcF family protein [Methylobacteriaceae bacterium]